MDITIKTILFWLFLIIGTFLSNSQNFYKTYTDIVSNNETLDTSKPKVDSLLTLIRKENNFKTSAKIAHDYSRLFNSNRKYDEALFYAISEVKDLDKAKSLNQIRTKNTLAEEVFENKTYATALHNVGLFYFKKGDIEKAIEAYKINITFNYNAKKTAQSYAGIARCYEKKGDYFKAVDFYEKCLFILEQIKDHPALLVHYYHNTAIAYDIINTKSSLTKAITYLKKADGLISKYDFLNTPSNNFYRFHTYANIYNKKAMFDFKKSAYNYKKSLEYNFKYYNDSLSISTIYSNLAELYLKEENDSVPYYIEKSLKYSQKDSLITLNCFLNKSLYLSNKNNHLEAIKNVHEALSYMIEIDVNDWTKTPSELGIKNAKNKAYILNALIKKAEILNRAYNNESNASYLKTALNTIKSADQLIDIIQQNSIESKSKFLWRNEASMAYSVGLESALLLKDEASAFYFMERNKAILLTENIIQNTEDTKRPQALYNRGISLKKKILRLEYKKQQKTLESENKVMADSLFNAKEKYQKYIDSVRTIHPNYLKKTLNIEQVTLENIQKELASNTVLISYMWNTTEDGDDNLYSLIANKQSNTLFKIEDVAKLRTLLTGYKTLLSHPLKNKDDKAEFRTTAFNLYETLFPTDAIRDTIKNKTLVIVADGEILNIPFEPLITQEDTDNYLLLSNDISYAYSFSFLEHNSNRIRTAENNFIGYATNATFSDSLNLLKNATKEVKTIDSIINGAVILDENATKAHFLNNSYNSKIIHLATHADASKNPWIAFSDEKLNLYELYTYKNNADLVTLSACNTSIGEIANGEGALSLARGFFYSGANSVVASLWNANDKSTAFLMEAFYKNLNEGQTKTEALNNAKRYYLKTHSLSETSPYYWASFTLIGDYETVIIPSYTTYYTIVMLSILLGLGLFFRKKIKKRRS